MGVIMGLKGYAFGFINELEARVLKVINVFEKAAVQTVAGAVEASKILTVGLIGAGSALLKQFVGTVFDVIRTSLEVALGELEDLTPKAASDVDQAEG
ncbi:hypothetical protein LCGC14_2756830 [marine sediment metagenome]|uniref:Uncharacterized protein n=1 Tax=marine sediment metagenome TaxID=412755 RepID=A0A0F8Z017_9ZZZZ